MAALLIFVGDGNTFLLKELKTRKLVIEIKMYKKSVFQSNLLKTCDRPINIILFY